MTTPFAGELTENVIKRFVREANALAAWMYEQANPSHEADCPATGYGMCDCGAEPITRKNAGGRAD